MVHQENSMMKNPMHEFDTEKATKASNKKPKTNRAHLKVFESKINELY